MADFDAFLAQDAILTEKRTKKGPKEIDLKPGIFASKTGLSGDAVALEITLPAGIFQHINPTLLPDACAAGKGIALDNRLIRRNAVLCKDGSRFA